jgi:hypothetical protein
MQNLFDFLEKRKIYLIFGEKIKNLFVLGNRLKISLIFRKKMKFAQFLGTKALPKTFSSKKSQ